MNRALITGRGLITPIGTGLAENTASLKAGRTGTVLVPEWRDLGLDSHVGGISNEDPDCPLLDQKTRRFTGPNSRMFVAAVWEALCEAGLTVEDLKKFRVAAVNGCAGSAYNEIYYSAKLFHETGKVKKVSPFVVPRVMASSAVSNISLILGITGEAYDISSACTSGAHASVLGARLIEAGMYDIVIAGGSEELNWVHALGFNAIRALSRKHNDNPSKASRPFDKDRDGFVIAEGAGAVILESEACAKMRGAKVRGIVSGHALNSNAVDMVVPDAESSSGVMLKAIEKAGLKPSDIGYVNTHGTATPVGDPAEMNALKIVFDGSNKVAINSTKSMTGHMIGAAGAAELIFCTIMMENNFICPSANLDNPEDEFAWADLVRTTRENVSIQHSLSNSFGFGGANACLVVSKP